MATPHLNQAGFFPGRLVIGWLVWSMWLATPLLGQDRAGAQSWQSLFDGETLAGWQGDRKYWRVERGALVGEIPAGERLTKNTWLVWQGEELRDFDLRLQFRLSGAPAANSGIQFRCQVRDVDHVSGYQADLDMGATWLGRIYDEHGRGLLVERGTRVLITPGGRRRRETFAPAEQFAVLFRPEHWNEYRIVAVGDQVAITINGTLFCELRDQQQGERDLSGGLALQLHSGPETKVEFRDIRLRRLAADAGLLEPLEMAPQDQRPDDPVGESPRGADGDAVDLGFESGSLNGWRAEGNAFQGQPVNRDGISSRWSDQRSNKVGDYFIGGFEVRGDGPTGTLTSPPLRVSHDYASFLLGGGRSPATRVEILQLATATPGDEPPRVVDSFSGNDREQMERVVVDLRELRGKLIAVRLVDESSGGWGHLNFDDFRMHAERPEFAASAGGHGRTTRHVLLHHLQPNPAASEDASGASETLRQMFVPDGFSVQMVAAEPDLHQPMAFCFDARGRLWVVEGHSYPQKRPPGQGQDRILIFSDLDGDGRYEDRRVFCEGLNLVSGMQVGFGGVWVGAAPELLFIPDRDGDDVPDGPPQVMLDGFGYADTHETINSFLWGPDGWLYGNQGVFNRSLVGAPGTKADERVALQAGVWRYHPTRHEFEVFAHGGSNQWGLDYDADGELFMTHCRSRWGGGPTTHVMQGGHYWNQVNGGYAPFVSAAPLPGRSHMRNYLAASAAYGHGEGGAGRRGSRAVYGGHSHVGTMIYLGDNWPAAYRGRLFTHNLHGHQMNQQVNRREPLVTSTGTVVAGGGYETWHAGRDTLLVTDPQYIGVDLQVGPDGAVYISDWYDPRHCHNPNVELWDRGNGRIYRMQYDATYRPAKIDLTAASDLELVELQAAENAWQARTARRVLAERAAEGDVDPAAIELAAEQFAGREKTLRLRSLWLLHQIGGLDAVMIADGLQHEDPRVRGWTIQLGLDSPLRGPVESALVGLAGRESDALVLRYLASALPRVSSRTAWDVAKAIAAKPICRDDLRLVKMLWYGIAPRVNEAPQRALQLAETTTSAALSDYLVWYAARSSPSGRDAVLRGLSESDEASQQRTLTLVSHAIGSMRGLAAAPSWERVAGRLYDSTQPDIRRAAEAIGAAFADDALFERMRARLLERDTPPDVARHALDVLAADRDPANLPVLLDLIATGRWVPRVLPLLGRFDDPRVAEVLLRRMSEFPDAQRDAALQVLTSRAAWARGLLDAIDGGQLDASLLTAYYARQIAGLGDAQLRDRLRARWGQLSPSSAETRHQIGKLVATYQEAPLWAYSARAGAAHFKQLCANCHSSPNERAGIAPQLAGSGSKGIEYIVENILAPNAVIGRDFQARVIATVDGRVLTGLIEAESASSMTIRTQTDSVTIDKEEVEQMRISENSFMPAGLLDQLSERERIELLKYLMSL